MSAKVVSGAFHWLNRYRASVALVFGVLAWIYLEQFTKAPLTITFAMALAMALSVLSVYLLNRTTDWAEDRIAQPTEAVSPTVHRPVAGIAFLMAAVAVGLTLTLRGPYLIHILFLLLGYLYSLPLPPRAWRLKQITGLKNLYPVLVGWIGFFYAMISRSPWFIGDSSALLRSLVYTGLLVLCYELLWDIRDVAGDGAAGIRTIPVVLGVLSTKMIIGLILIVATQSLTRLTSWQTMNLAYLGIAVVLTNADRPAWYFHTLLYGQALLLLVMYL